MDKGVRQSYLFAALNFMSEENFSMGFKAIKITHKNV